MQIRLILDEIDQMGMVIPEFQREYVWSLENAKQLMVSLFREYPTGSILVWQAKQEDIPEIKNNAVVKERLGSVDVILDGQQRLTTLYLLIRGKIPPYYTESEIMHDPRELHFNLQSGEFQYFAKSKMSGNCLWQKVSDCFDMNKVNPFDIVQTYIDNHPDNDFKTLMKPINDNLNKLRRVESLEYPVQTVPSSANIDDAIDVFDRVNSQGTKLTEAELVLTHVTGKWPHARRVFKDKIDLLRKEGFEMDLDLITRFLVVALTQSALFGKNAKLTYEIFTEIDYKTAWERVSRALDYFIPILKHEGFVANSDELNSLNTLVPIIAYLLTHNIQFTREKKYGFLYWMFLAHIWGRYSGQTSQKLDKDVYISTTSSSPIEELIDEIEDQRGRITVESSDLEGRGAGHPLYKMLYIVTKHNKAVDWANGSILMGTIGGNYSIQSHHIFPQAVLLRAGFNPENHLEKMKINEIANRAFITRDTNYNISDKNPAEYLSAIKDQYPKELEKHFIPTDPRYWEIDNYELFLERRRAMIAAAINDFLGFLKKTASGEVESIKETDWLGLIKGGENDYLEFKSTMRWDLRQNQINKDLEHVIVKTICAFLNSEGGKLLIGVDDEGDILGLENDYQTLGRKQDKDGFLLKLVDIVNNYLGKECHQYLRIAIVEIEGKEVCIIEVGPSNQPVFLQNNNIEEFYIRASASSQPMSMREAYEYIDSHWNS